MTTPPRCRTRDSIVLVSLYEPKGLSIWTQTSEREGFWSTRWDGSREVKRRTRGDEAPRLYYAPTLLRPHSTVCPSRTVLCPYALLKSGSNDLRVCVSPSRISSVPRVIYGLWDFLVSPIESSGDPFRFKRVLHSLLLRPTPSHLETL